MDFIVKFDDIDIDDIRHKFIRAVKRFALYSKQEQLCGNVDKAEHFYYTACNYVWSAHEFGLIPLQTAFDLIMQIAEYRYQKN